GWSGATVHELTRIDPWFLRNIEELVEVEGEIARSGIPDASAEGTAALARWKRLGFSDRRLGALLGTDAHTIRGLRQRLGVLPVYKTVDTCAAEFAAYTPYLYSTYEPGACEAAPTDRRKI